jgi:hypothetical protein
MPISKHHIVPHKYVPLCQSKIKVKQEKKQKNPKKTASEDRETHTGRTKAEIQAMQLQTKECQRWLTATRS